ncbi:MAG: hypothetical protein U0359_01360 [Byssovorax sp.]
MKRAATHRRIGRAGAALLAGISALLGLGACQYLAGRDVVRGTLIDGGSGDGAGGGTGGSGGGMAAPIDYACAWVKDFGEEVDSKVALALDSAGAVIVAGGYRGNIDFGGGAIAAGDPAAHDVFIAKLGGAMGEYKWAAGFGDDGSTQIAQMIAATSDSIFVAGTYQGVLNAPGACGAVPMAGDDDAFLLKLTPEGDCVAGTTYGFEMSKDHAAAMAASETDVMLLPSCHDESEMHVVRYDTNLSQLDHCAFVDPIPMMPAVLHIHPRAASIAGQNVYFAGGFNGTMVPCTKSNSVFNQSFASSEDAFVGAVAIQNIGGLVDPSLWTFNWGDQVTQSFSAIAADPGGAIVMAGAMEGTMNFGATVLSASPGGKDALIAQVSLNGTPDGRSGTVFSPTSPERRSRSTARPLRWPSRATSSGRSPSAATRSSTPAGTARSSSPSSARPTARMSSAAPTATGCSAASP